jgi:hypothetical protein
MKLFLFDNYIDLMFNNHNTEMFIYALSVITMTIFIEFKTSPWWMLGFEAN